MFTFCNSSWQKLSTGCLTSWVIYRLQNHEVKIAHSSKSFTLAAWFPKTHVFFKTTKIGKCNIKSQASQNNASTKETREGWPLLTVETKVNGDTKRTNKRCHFLGWFVVLVVPVQEILFCLGCSSRPSTKFQFQFLCPYSAQQAGDRQPCWVACLLVCVSLAPTLSNVIILFSL